MQVKRQQLELDMKQQTSSKSVKEPVKAVYCHPAYLTYMQSTSCEMLGWMKHRLESRLLGEISITSDMQIKHYTETLKSCLPEPLFISWLWSPSLVILEPKKIKSVTVSTISPYICHEVMGPDAMILAF